MDISKNFLLQIPFSKDLLRTKWRFVIKKHRASKLHYDFRLEFPGVLKSWVIDKSGPTMQANKKKETKMVDDHNPAYIDREGIIPEGKKGAGETMVWDIGGYFPIHGGGSRITDFKIFRKMLTDGEMHFFLAGTKLRGEFKLIRKYYYNEYWDLIKIPDAFCHDEDMRKFNKSVISQRTLYEIKTGTNKHPDNYTLFPV